MAFKSAEELMSAGFNGKWYRASSEFEKEVIINSIAGDNLVRGSKGLPALRHYEKDGYILVADGPQADEHPNDKKSLDEKAGAAYG